MSTPYTALRGAIRALDRVTPLVAAAATYPLFSRVGRRRRVHPREHATDLQARRRYVSVGRRRVVVYEWGSGPRAVLLVHGWQGRSSQFAALVRELRFAGFRVIAFDAPAMGDSPGRRTHVGEFHAVIDELARREPGGLHAIVAHSAGVMPAVAAASESRVTDRIVAIAPIVRFRYLNEAFAQRLGLGERARLWHEAWVTARMRRVGIDIYARYDLLARELPRELRITVVHDRDDRLSAIDESRRLAARYHGQVSLIETIGLGHSRILESDIALDAVLEVVEQSDAAVRRNTQSLEPSGKL